MNIRPIRNEADHEAALARVRELMSLDDQAAIDEVDVLQTLIEKWERAKFKVRAVSPSEAIRFRMQQLGLKPRDLEAYIGAKSRVSEILGGRRQLTVDQIRALNTHLGIPLELLVGAIKYEPSAGITTTSAAAVEKLRRLGVMKARETIEAFLARATAVAPDVKMLRKTRTERTNAKTDFGALEAWCAAVMLKAEGVEPRRGAQPNVSHGRELAQISRDPNWPDALKRYLASIGVVFIVLEHLPGTYLDGAAMRRADGTPVIAITVRHDRLDNFWFTLLHEFAHVVLHLNKAMPLILDDLDVNSSEGIEAQADEYARNALIPAEIWKKHVTDDMDTADVEELGALAGVHAAIVAGRWRYENSDYRKFARILGRGEVRDALLS
ncbi:ImmA/IrrE family metallo-endopeptidase (plasmid) [Rhizobium ruizarguesonis]|uniref:ImmA/IrrE family metallo-endopeptidase n=1 Tax=Rhizobium ruizarguesonis TaxID=2081791 RepID=UPI0010315DE4|nr:ImmA/IrrE family metallo-endopeptidase [Rhizobium ruizarguesonis]TAT96167.1 ImmA/IrrE family metallo-endopeptidase [Rhizobium ruizarguesonis]